MIDGDKRMLSYIIPEDAGFSIISCVLGFALARGTWEASEYVEDITEYGVGRNAAEMVGEFLARWAGEWGVVYSLPRVLPWAGGTAAPVGQKGGSPRCGWGGMEGGSGEGGVAD
jgi:hypothetical protein